jgi:hypothetical protein
MLLRVCKRRLSTAKGGKLSKAPIFKEKPVPLGPLELKVPMGVGTWSWGEKFVWGYDAYDKSYNAETIFVFFFSLISRMHSQPL